MQTNLFLNAFREKGHRPPVWFMRQAGRYLPEYQALKSKYDFWEMTENPELASLVTLMPVQLLDVDAAILFKDILTLPKAMGFNIRFVQHQGPVIDNPLEMNSKTIWPIFDHLNLESVTESIRQVKKELPSHIPLIGFAGSPFTVLCYLIEGKGPRSFHKIFHWMHACTNQFHQLMEVFTQYTIDYIRLQKQAGIDAFQIFDTWGGILTHYEYRNFVLPYLNRIFDEAAIPSIYFLKQGEHLLPLIESIKSVDFFSVCHTVSLESVPRSLSASKGIQGNLSPSYLYMPAEKLLEEVDAILKVAQSFPRYIFNLGHGLFQDTPVPQVKEVISHIKHISNWHALS